MSLYVDTSALMKRYVKESDSSTFVGYLEADSVWITARHTEVENRLNLARLLDGRQLEKAHRDFRADWERIHKVELNADVCRTASEIAEMTGARTLDALHLAAAGNVGGGRVPILTADKRLALITRALGWTALGS